MTIREILNRESPEMAQEMLNAYTRSVLDCVDTLEELNQDNVYRNVCISESGKYRPRGKSELAGIYWLMRRLANRWLGYDDQMLFEIKMDSFLQDHCALLADTDLSKERKQED
tara:strand:- start:1513 stop:1851 length:339 start_codon:yes stop_codon:yes gene_type:complete